MPVIALTGYLGAGKTTLLNHLLRRPGARLGVVVNDFGAVNVDASLITGQAGDIQGIAGGCVCCLEDAGGLDDALDQLTAPRLGLDAVIVEASGLAEPPVLARLIRYSGAERARPGGVVELIDAVECFRTVDDGPEPPARYAAASLIVITKADLLPPSERAERLAVITERVHRVNPGVVVTVADRGRIDPELIHDVATNEDPPDQLPLAALARAEHHHAGHAHAQSTAAEVDGSVDPGAVLDLLSDPPAGVYRIKGRVCLGDAAAPRWYVVHAVGRLVHVESLPELLRPSLTRSELVAIGPGFDSAVVYNHLARALTPSERSSAESWRRWRRAVRLSL